ncbi:NSUN2 [Symbiodinium microadriaticum]|nr:NSUN2 [Symbiodinium microadriaticum]
MRHQKNPIDLLQWDDESFQMVLLPVLYFMCILALPILSLRDLTYYIHMDQVQEHFGLQSLTGQEFYIREDFNTAAKRASKAGESSASKSVYYLPPAMRDIIRGDEKSRLKVVMAGIKVFERSQKGAFAWGGECGYRLNQDGVSVMAPHITKRKITCTVQDFCNFLEGGLISFTTLSKSCLEGLSQVSSGSVMCVYHFSPEDIVQSEENTNSTSVDDRVHTFHAVCWRGVKNTLNVMCAKPDLEDMRHQFQALKIWRPKLASTAMKPSKGVSQTDQERAESGEENDGSAEGGADADNDSVKGTCDDAMEADANDPEAAC